MPCVIYLRVSTREQAEKGEGEEGFSIPAQRGACTRHIRDAGCLLAEEYLDRGESARRADRPALKAMLARIAEDRDVDTVVVHKIDRLARNMEDHVAIRALFRRRGVALVSVTENVEETASGRLVEGIHALMAEFYSANLAAEIEERQASDAAQRELLTGQLAKAEGERRKLLDAYYGGAIDVSTLKAEQARIGSAIEAAKDRLADLDANLGEQQEILDLAASLATRCGDANRKANDRTRKLFNSAVFERLDVKGGRLCHEQYRPPFDGVFTVSELEYGTRVVVAPPKANRCRSLDNPSTWENAGRLFRSAGTRWLQPSRHWPLVGERRSSP